MPATTKTGKTDEFDLDSLVAMVTSPKPRTRALTEPALVSALDVPDSEPSRDPSVEVMTPEVALKSTSPITGKPGEAAVRAIVRVELAAILRGVIEQLDDAANPRKA